MPAAEREASVDDGASSGNGGRTPLATPVPCLIFLPVVPAARVIGKGGASVKAIREQSGATVRILQKELPQEMQRREDRVILISGSSQAVRAGVQGVLERVFDRSGLPATRQSGANERAYVVEVLVPEKSGAHIIGTRGERIKSLIQETNCDLHVVKEPMNGLQDLKRVRVTGSTADEASSAVLRLQELLAELQQGGILRPEHFDLRESGEVGRGERQRSPSARRGDGYLGGVDMHDGPRPRQRDSKEVPIRLLVSKDEAAWIVGKRGNKIMRLRDFAKVQMNDADSPPLDVTERVVEISNSSLEQRLHVVQLILEDLAVREEASDTLRLLVPTSDFGSVMGHKGENIRSIIQKTGADVQQKKAEKLKDGEEYRLRLVVIKGDEHQRVEVVRLVFLAVERRDKGGSGGGYERPSDRPSSDRYAGDRYASDRRYDTDLRDNRSGHGDRSDHSGRVDRHDRIDRYEHRDRGDGRVDRHEHRGNNQVFTTPSPVSLVGGHGRTLSDDGLTGPSTIGTLGSLDDHDNADVDGGLPASNGFLGGGGGGGQLSLQLAMPSEDIAREIAMDSSGIARRAGVRLNTARGPHGIPMLQLTGTAVANSVACYLIQDRLFMMH